MSGERTDTLASGVLYTGVGKRRRNLRLALVADYNPTSKAERRALVQWLDDLADSMRQAWRI